MKKWRNGRKYSITFVASVRILIGWKKTRIKALAFSQHHSYSFLLLFNNFFSFGLFTSLLLVFNFPFLCSAFIFSFIISKFYNPRFFSIVFFFLSLIFCFYLWCYYYIRCVPFVPLFIFFYSIYLSFQFIHSSLILIIIPSIYQRICACACMYACAYMCSPGYTRMYLSSSSFFDRRRSFTLAVYMLRQGYIEF